MGKMEHRRLKKRKALVTGSGGLIGSEAVRFFSKKGFEVFGIDNDMRKAFFGSQASNARNIRNLKKNIPRYRHFNIDIRNRKKIEGIFMSQPFDLVIHAAAQPSHDWAAREPLTDFSINADATLFFLENFRKYAPRGVFIFVSTNKVYGDLPNKLPFMEGKKRFEIDSGHPFHKGINESMSVDQSMHSLFGVSKLAADVSVQEYGRYFGLKTVCLRASCVTGPAQTGTPMHGFLSFLGQCVATGRIYTIYGYKGKQVRDNIHAYDFVNAMYHFYLKPKCGEVYNMGGSRFSNVSVREALEKFEKALHKKAVWEYVDKPRTGDHMWYISDVSKFRKDFPHWDYRYHGDAIIEEISKVK